ncbi:potassium transporter TrkA [Candidatus Poribacteria bacterium]|nr:potassium transporter TrkA [Candidatus Poribacteria bacterium]MBT7096332.1 potassium transporter TrkA [Candidatus Poribacteria bacterium]MBT7808639.1 potassium transporter TrkA [Candidatus Poribacteria bacterium]
MSVALSGLVVTAAFLMVALASKEIGAWFSRARLPLITGFLFTGVIAGPHVFGLVSADAISRLRLIDEVSLAVIAFAAGSELYVEELRGRFKSIRWTTIGLMSVTFTAGTVSVLLLGEWIPFVREMPTTGRVAVALLAGVILVARSPSSAIAVINELRARGPFTQTAMGVTVIMDVGVIVLFGVCSSIADALVTGVGVEIRFALLLAAELVAAAVLGFIGAGILRFILSRHRGIATKAALTLVAGYGAFLLSSQARRLSHDHLGVEVFIEPLLICMLASFIVTNRTRYRQEFVTVLDRIGPVIYILFFTLTGASLDLHVLRTVWPAALALVVIRLGALAIGSFVGSMAAGESVRFSRLSWMAYVTQAGVGLGLAKEVAVEFGDWGAQLATLLIAMIVVNQVVGPPLFKWVLHLIGEAHPRGEGHGFYGAYKAVICGLEGQSRALGRQLAAHGWKVTIATRQPDPRPEESIEIRTVSAWTADELGRLGAQDAEAVVAMLSDEESLDVCQECYERFGTDNLIVRLNDHANVPAFREIGAHIVDLSTAVVGLLEHCVRAPSATALLLGTDGDQDVVEVEVGNADLDGLALRDLRMPSDTLVLSVRRGDSLLLSHGYTQIKVGDWVTVVGSVDSLNQVSGRLEA